MAKGVGYFPAPIWPKPEPNCQCYKHVNVRARDFDDLKRLKTHIEAIHGYRITYTDLFRGMLLGAAEALGLELDD